MNLLKPFSRPDKVVKRRRDSGQLPRKLAMLWKRPVSRVNLYTDKIYVYVDFTSMR